MCKLGKLLNDEIFQPIDKITTEFSTVSKDSQIPSILNVHFEGRKTISLSEHNLSKGLLHLHILNKLQSLYILMHIIQKIIAEIDALKFS